MTLLLLLTGLLLLSRCKGLRLSLWPVCAGARGPLHECVASIARLLLMVGEVWVLVLLVNLLRVDGICGR